MNQSSYYTEYEDTCRVHNTDTGKIKIADVLDFKPGKRLIVSIERVAKVTLEYNSYHGIYVGSSAKLEFTSEGPSSYEYRF